MLSWVKIINYTPYLYFLINKELFTSFAVSLYQSSMVDTDSKRQCQFQVCVFYPSNDVLHLKKKCLEKMCLNPDHEV